MTWRTPCTDPDNDTELWTSDDSDEREEAATLCHTCPRLLACFADAEAMKRKGLEVSGVHGGFDYTRTKRQKQARVCEGPGCDTELPRTSKPGRSRRFCSDSCRGNFNYRARSSRVKTCEGCGVEFQRGKLSSAQWEARRFCSVACSCRTLRPERAA